MSRDNTYADMAIPSLVGRTLTASEIEEAIADLPRRLHAERTPEPMTARAIAAKAADLVGGDRDRQHGAKADNFNRIAKLWQAYLEIRRDPAKPLDGVDVGHMMGIFKVARTQSGSLNPDDYIDGAGYLACAGEIATSGE